MDVPASKDIFIAYWSKSITDTGFSFLYFLGAVSEKGWYILHIFQGY